MAPKADIVDGLSHPDLLNMPTEVLHQIFRYLAQSDLRSLTISHREISTVAAALLYRSPTFHTSYRLAQFTTTIATCKQYADMVRDLDILRPVGDLENQSLASWAEWKYRTSPIYAAMLPENDTTHHPRANRFLGMCRQRAPLGMILHLLTACSNLRELSINTLAFEKDWEILSGEKPLPASRMIFISDVPRSARPRNATDRAVNPDEIIQQIAQLKQLEGLVFVNVRKGWQMIGHEAGVILAGCPKLRFGAFHTNDKWYEGDRDYLMRKIEAAGFGKERGVQESNGEE